MCLVGLNDSAEHCFHHILLHALYQSQCRPFLQLPFSRCTERKLWLLKQCVQTLHFDHILILTHHRWDYSDNVANLTSIAYIFSFLLHIFIKSLAEVITDRFLTSLKYANISLALWCRGICNAKRYFWSECRSYARASCQKEWFSVRFFTQNRIKWVNLYCTVLYL